MTQQPDAAQVAAPLIDQGNPFIAAYPARLHTGGVTLPTGNKIALTVRCGSATVTVLLSKPEALEWAQAIQTAAAAFSDLIVPTALVPPGLNGNGAPT